MLSNELRVDHGNKWSSKKQIRDSVGPVAVGGLPMRVFALVMSAHLKSCRGHNVIAGT